MHHRAPLSLVLITVYLVSLVWLIPTASPAGVRHAGTLLAVDASAGRATLEEYWVNGQRRVLTIRITPDTQVVLSERNEKSESFADTFVTTQIDARDLKVGDFVVVEVGDGARDGVASLVMVTRPAAAGS